MSHGFRGSSLRSALLARAMTNLVSLFVLRGTATCFVWGLMYLNSSKLLGKSGQVFQFSFKGVFWDII